MSDLPRVNLDLEKQPSHSEMSLYPLLRDDDEFLIAFLNECFHEQDIKVFLAALQDVMKAKDINISDLCRRSGFTRSAFYKMLSEEGNPSFLNLKSILSALGIDIQLVKQGNTQEVA